MGISDLGSIGLMLSGNQFVDCAQAAFLTGDGVSMTDNVFLRCGDWGVVLGSNITRANSAGNTWVGGACSAGSPTCGDIDPSLLSGIVLQSNGDSYATVGRLNSSADICIAAGDGGQKRVFADHYPTSGAWNAGDIVWNSQPGTNTGWVCTVAGVGALSAWNSFT
jgi:hypothetical protein